MRLHKLRNIKRNLFDLMSCTNQIYLHYILWLHHLKTIFIKIKSLSLFVLPDNVTFSVIKSQGYVNKWNTIKIINEIIEPIR